MDEFDFLPFVQQASNLDPVGYQYFYQLLKKRTIIFNADVDESIVETVYLPLKDFEEDDSQAPITLILNSSGGSVSDGFFLANYLTHYSKPLKIIVTGYACSMATILLAAGGKNDNITRVCYPNTYALIHDGYVALSASESKTASDIMSFNDTVDNNIRQFMIDNTNITQELYDSKSRHQWFIHAQEMKELNLVDKILGVDE